jgi:lipopolysaccharide export LptBFGC system permease protein LptF
VAGYIALAKVFVLCGLFGARQAWHDWNTDDQQNLARVLWRVGLVTIAFAALIEMPELMRLPQTLQVSPDARTGLLIAYLVPAALATSIPIGMMIGTLLGLAGRTRSRRLPMAVLLAALAISVSSFLNLGWIVPAANQSYREEIVGGSVPRGERELTLLDMRHTAEALRRWDEAYSPANVRERARRLAFSYHQRFAFALAPLTLTVLALLLVPRRRLSMPAAAVIVCVAVAGSLFVWRLGPYLYQIEVVPPPLGAWLPHLIVAAAAACLTITRRWTELTRTRA